jgi:23S rRNA pseudouridine1911/1915/1917 synthase
VDERIEITPADAGTRLDLLLARRLSLSRTSVKRLLRAGDVRVDGRRQDEHDKGLILRAGAIVLIANGSNSHDVHAIAQPDLSLNILAEGNDWVVVDKPAGIPVHPLEIDEQNTVLNAVIARYPSIHGVGEGGLRSGVVHRLDVDTSGTLAFALSASRWESMRSAFTEHRTEKIYRAIVSGRVRDDGSATMNLVITRHRPAVVSVVENDENPPGMRRCDLRWRIVERLRNASLIEVNLGTGFLHQIRVMLAHIGHPVLGDRVYGQPGNLPRQMLHASHLRIDDISATCPDPADFAAALADLRTT